MTGIDAWRSRLREVDEAERPHFLDLHSGLPGPRGNIELALAFASIATPAMADDLARSDDEYRAFCGTVALGARAENSEVLLRLHQAARDSRWRIREAVAMALQGVGDRDPAALRALALAWADDPDPLVERAAAAGICEPRLLRDPATAQAAVEVCRRATARLAARPRHERRDPGLRTLRQGLGYCWSVAVAAAPEHGGAVFTALDTADPDVAWIVRENLRKRRMPPV